MKVSKVIKQLISLANTANQARDLAAEEDSLINSPASYTTTVKLRIPEEQRLKEFLDKQPASIIYLALALMYLGMGDLEAKDLLERAAELPEEFGDPRLAARLMFNTAFLPELLGDGLATLADAGLHLDKLSVS